MISRKTFLFVLTFILIFLISRNFYAESGVSVTDTPDDSGRSISVQLDISGKGITGEYRLFRISPDGYDREVHKFRIDNDDPYSQLVQDDVSEDYTGYRYILYYRPDSGTGYRIIYQSNPVESYPQWFNVSKLPVLIGALLYVFVLFISIRIAKSGGIDYIRKLPGLEAIDDAVGRATEMGKPVLYLTGLERISNIATIASLDILARVSKRVAEYETPLIVPCFDPIVLIIAREIVRESYQSMGRADKYREDDIYYITGNPFGFVAAVDGIMLRDRPAANFYLGAFYSDSLILAETGASTGAIQIAGTDSPIQLPFFIAACDYTLLGEELYAASAYLSRKKELLGTLKALDIMKILIMIFIVLGSILITFDIDITVFLVR